MPPILKLKLFARMPDEIFWKTDKRLCKKLFTALANDFRLFQTNFELVFTVGT